MINLHLNSAWADWIVHGLQLADLELLFLESLVCPVSESFRSCAFFINSTLLSVYVKYFSTEKLHAKLVPYIFLPTP